MNIGTWQDRNARVAADTISLYFVIGIGIVWAFLLIFWHPITDWIQSAGWIGWLIMTCSGVWTYYYSEGNTEGMTFYWGAENIQQIPYKLWRGGEGVGIGILTATQMIFDTGQLHWLLLGIIAGIGRWQFYLGGLARQKRLKG